VHFSKYIAFLTVLVLTAIGGALPAAAKSENRIRIEAIQVFVPKTFAAPKSGCTSIPIRYEWRFFLNHESIGAYFTLETKSEWTIGEVYLQPSSTGGSGVVDLKICSTRWIGDEEVIDGKTYPGDVFQRAKKGNYIFNLTVWDFDNKENLFQQGRKPLRLR
jgi:hypothetical protein